jgi:hypothetical protein
MLAEENVVEFNSNCLNLPTRKYVSMDFDQILSSLRVEKENIDKVIASLEDLQTITSNAAKPWRRGRKSMNEEERREVSARMKRYWAERRKPHQPT